MIYTDNGTKVTWKWCPLAMANGVEWGATQRRYEPLYRRHVVNRLLYAIGWAVGKVYRPRWVKP